MICVITNMAKADQRKKEQLKWKIEWLKPIMLKFLTIWCLHVLLIIWQRQTQEKQRTNELKIEWLKLIIVCRNYERFACFPFQFNKIEHQEKVLLSESKSKSKSKKQKQLRCLWYAVACSMCFEIPFSLQQIVLKWNKYANYKLGCRDCFQILNENKYLF